MTVGQALAALPGPADLKEFVFLLFFQKQKRKKEKSSSSTCFHLLPESRPRRTPLSHCNKANLSLQTISSPPSAAAIPSGSPGHFQGKRKTYGGARPGCGGFRVTLGRPHVAVGAAPLPPPCWGGPQARAPRPCCTRAWAWAPGAGGWRPCVFKKGWPLDRPLVPAGGRGNVAAGDPAPKGPPPPSLSSWPRPNPTDIAVCPLSHSACAPS